MKHLNVVLMAAVVAISLPVVAHGQSYEMRRDYRDDRGGRGDYYREDRGSRGYDERRGGAVCAQENGFCQFRGEATVRYGAHGRYAVRHARNGIPCNNRVFGDPAPGVPKRCIIE